MSSGSGLRRLGAALLGPFRRGATAYNEAAKRNPATVGIITSCIKTGLADAAAQVVVERREEFDWKRNAMFTMFGFAYLGGFQYWLYNHAFVRICKPITARVGHVGAAPVKTFIDQGIHHPFVYLPAFYLCKGAVEGRPVASSLQRCKEDMWENLKALWMVWVPAQLVNFAVVPLHLRVPFVAAVSFAWTVIISVMRGALQPAVTAEEAAAAAASGTATTHAADTSPPMDPADVPGMLGATGAAASAMPILPHHLHLEEENGGEVAGGGLLDGQLTAGPHIAAL